MLDILKSAPVVPLVQSNKPQEAVKIAGALLNGGLKVLEVVLRTDEAFECLQEVSRAFPETPVGAGTVLSGQQAQKAFDLGAKFIVSPGLHENVVQVAKDCDIPILPGVATASELQNAWNMDLRLVKFFPAKLAGGPAMLKALSSVFRDVHFMPTGGVSVDNLKDYLAVPSVIACGGSWLTPKSAIQAENFTEISRLAKEALDIVAD